MATITVHAHAKINLSLKITGRRDDGYHSMDSLVVFADLADRITIDHNPDSNHQDDHITLTGPQANNLHDVAAKDNLLIKAKNRYCAVTGWQQNLAITLEKNIPVAAGIGGGSSDAAAVLWALNQCNPNPTDDETLAKIGLTIGADLPVCLKQYQHPFWRMQGIGEHLSPVRLPSLKNAGLILVNPLITLATKDVFTQLALDKTQQTAEHETLHLEDLATLTDWLAVGNDLTAPAQSLAPAIGHDLHQLSALSDHPGYLHHGMSGSGATCYALFDTPLHAVAALQCVKDDMAWSWAGKLLG